MIIKSIKFGDDITFLKLNEDTGSLIEEHVDWKMLSDSNIKSDIIHNCRLYYCDKCGKRYNRIEHMAEHAKACTYKGWLKKPWFDTSNKFPDQRLENLNDVVITSEYELMAMMHSFTNSNPNNRLIVTGANGTGKSTLLDKMRKSMRCEKPCKYPDFELGHENDYLMLKYHHIIDRWFPWDRAIFDKDKKFDIDDNYGFNIVVVIFVGRKYGLDGKDIRTDDYTDKYRQLGRELVRSGLFKVWYYDPSK